MKVFSILVSLQGVSSFQNIRAANTHRISSSLFFKSTARRTMGTEQSVKDFIASFVEMNEEVAVNGSDDASAKFRAMLKNGGEGVDYIRPSGNPMSMEEYQAMMSSKDIEYSLHKLVSIDSVTLLADNKVAITLHKTHDKFSYQGSPNDDVAAFSSVLEEIDGEWKVAHIHRATGQPPKE